MVQGYYDTIKDVLKIEEYKIDYTKSKADKSKMCYLKLELKSTKLPESKVWKGKFKGYYLNNQKCSEGSIILTERSTILKLMDSFKNLTIDKELKPLKAEVPQKIEYLGKDSPAKIKTKSDSCIIHIWDDYQIDNDLVNIYLNGVLKYSNFSLSKKPLKFKVSSYEPHNIEIKAINEGFIPPNTSKIKIVDGSSHYLYFNELKINESSYIRLE
jgi:hypothetical protein